MAISSSKYVGAMTNANTQQVALVSFSNAGLVITGALVGNTEDEALLDKKEKFDNGEIVALNVAEATALFGPQSPESYFATGYFSYVAPNGLFPQVLYFKKYGSVSGENGLVDEVADAFAKPVDFGSFTFLSIPDESTSNDLEDIMKVASFNSANENRKMFVVNFQRSTGSSAELGELEAVARSLSSVRGCCLVYGSTPWSSFMPMTVMAAQNIVTSGVLQFMFNRFVPPTEDDVPTVNSDSDYTLLSSLNVNFLGRTQVNGQTLDFFQRGYATNGEDLTFQMASNWIEQQTRASIMNLFVSQVMPATDASVLAVEAALGTVMRSARDSGIAAPMASVSDENHQKIVNEIVIGMGGDLEDANQIETNLTIDGYGFYVKLNGSRNLADISGGHVEPTISYKVIYAYSGAIRFIGGEYKVVSA